MDVHRAIRTRPFWLLTLAFTFQTAAVITVVTHVMPYLNSIGIPRMTAGVMGTAIPLLSIPGRLGLGMMGDRFGRTQVATLAYVMMGLGTLFFAAIPTLGIWTLYAFLLMFGVGYGGLAALRPALTRECFGRGHFGSIFGLVIGINAIGGIVGPPVAGWFYDTWGDYRAVWIVISLLSIAAAGLIAASRRYRLETRTV